MEEMMITTTAFIRGEAAAASKKKGHVSWKPHDQSKRYSADKRSDFRDHSREGRKPNQFTPSPRRRKKSWLPKRENSRILLKKSNKDETSQKRERKRQHPKISLRQSTWCNLGKKTVKRKVTQSFERVGEIAFPKLAASNGTEGPLVIEAEMGGHIIHRMYINGGSSMEILYEHCFNRLRPEIKSQMVPATTSLTGFSGETIWPLGQLRLLVTIGDATHSTRAWMNFMVVKSMSPYNGIIGQPGLKAIQAVPSAVHEMLKFPDEEEKSHPANFTVDLHLNFPDQEVVIGGSLSDKGRTALCSVLKKNLDIFAWQPSDMTEVPRSVAEHRLNIREGYSPVRQKKRGQAPERAKAIQAEVQKLVDAGIMREVYYHDWLSNPVMDCYPLSEIDWKVESLCGYPFKCFLDAYKGYHQIQLAEADEEKTAFHKRQGVYCYTKMPFSLKNAGTTYHHTEDEMVRDIEETFRTLRKVYMKLNPKKCSFGLAEGVFLGPDDGKGNNSNADLLHKPRVTGSGTKLLADGEIGAGLILTNQEGVEFTYTLRFQFTASNNEAGYEALVAGLRIAARMGVKNVQVLVEVLENKSLKENEVTPVIEEDGLTWMTQLVEYLKEGVLPGDKKEARKLRLKARQYELMEGVLYRRSFLTPWLRCVGPFQADYVMKEIHEGSCSMHAGPRSVVAKAVRLRYYWSTMHKDARDMIRKCKDCQIHRPVTRHPQQSLTPITAPWPFYKWGIDIAGPFPEGSGKVKFLIVAMDYFTKWIEAKAVATITGGQRFASVKHPQSNELVERANQSLEEGIKARLGEGNKNWVEELPHIGMPTYRTAAIDVVNNDEELRLNLDLLEERRERAGNDASHAVAGEKLGPKWGGPYEVTEALGNGAYKLRSTDGTVLPIMWNVTNLKRCYL
nr:reverse transcriptase domain-containing protein [Tanacetum cinerariifolium]